jgi:hypothetical protein
MNTRNDEPELHDRTAAELFYTMIDIILPGVTDEPDVPRPAKTRKKRDRVILIPINHIRPAELNDLVYRPVDRDDPGFVALVESIRAHGQLEPIVVTAAGVILSGHRRYAACKALGMARVRCRREHVASTDRRFPELLVSYNRQRD